MIQKFVLGNPYKTESVVKEVKESSLNQLPSYIHMADDHCSFSIALDPLDAVFGLGESLHGMNKRGFVYEMFNTDQVKHDENQYSLYGSHDFLLIDGPSKEKIGLFVDDPGKVVFDIGFTDKDLFTAKMIDTDYALYVVTGESSLDVVREFREAIGESYKAPLWAFGYLQSRWGYKCADDILEIVNQHEKWNLPLEGVCMDIDYMTDYKVFTVDPEKFPDFKNFVAGLKKKHIHLLPNMDNAVKAEEGFSVYEEGLKRDYYCKDANGNNFMTAVWPGKSVLLDFFRPEVRKWFGEQYKVLTDAGVDGFWNDMNEPAIFYSMTNLKETAEKLSHLKDECETLDLYTLWDYKDMVNSLDNNMKDYQSFYHNMDGKLVPHDRVHNLFGFNVTRSAAEAFPTIAPNAETLLFSRASMIGMHRYAGIWTGDNSSYYSHIELLMHQLPGLNMCGFLYTGADTGGFAFHTSEHLMMRFLQLSLFTPLFRNHCALGCRDQELYRFKDIDSFRNLLNLRYALIPTLYAIYEDAIKNNKLMFSPLAFSYSEDPLARGVEDQLMLGDDFMIAPVYKANATGRSVYIPEDMTAYVFKAYDDYRKFEVKKGFTYIDIALNEVVLFVKKGKELHLTKPANNTYELYH